MLSLHIRSSTMDITDNEERTYISHKFLFSVASVRDPYNFNRHNALVV